MAAEAGERQEEETLAQSFCPGVTFSTKMQEEGWEVFVCWGPQRRSRLGPELSPSCVEKGG